MDFTAGDIGHVERNYGHYVENRQYRLFLGTFRAPPYEEISLSNWLTHTPPALVAQHLNIDPATITMPKQQSRHHARVSPLVMDGH